MGSSILQPLLLSVLAGLSTALGGLVIFVVEEPQPRFMAFTLALAAGVMISVSVLELLQPVLEGQIAAVGWAVAGVVSYVFLSRFLPEHPHPPSKRHADDASADVPAPVVVVPLGASPPGRNSTAAVSTAPLTPSPLSSSLSSSSSSSSLPPPPPPSSPPSGSPTAPLMIQQPAMKRKRSEGGACESTHHRHPHRHPHHPPGQTPPPPAAATAHADEMERARQLRLGVLMMATLTAHNLPEGLAVAVGALSSTRTGLVVTAAIAMHNIPEGLAIAVPVYAATHNRWVAVGMTVCSGLSEPLGAILGLLVLQPFLNRTLLDNATSAVGGIMCAVSVLELLPEARKHNEVVGMGLGFLTGWIVIAATVAPLHGR